MSVVCEVLCVVWKEEGWGGNPDFFVLGFFLNAVCIRRCVIGILIRYPCIYTLYVRPVCRLSCPGKMRWRGACVSFRCAFLVCHSEFEIVIGRLSYRKKTRGHTELVLDVRGRLKKGKV